MTQPTSTVPAADSSDETPADVGLSTPRLAAIQHSYEEARASIVDPTTPPSAPATDDAATDDAATENPAADDPTADDVDLHPETEQIDVEAALPPVPRSGPTPEAAVVAGRRTWWQAVRAALRGGRPAHQSAP